MPTVLHNFWLLLAVLIGVIFLAYLAWRRLDLAGAIVLFLAPLYLLKIVSLPLTVLELLLLILIFVWLLKRWRERHLLIFLRGLDFFSWWLPVILLLAGFFFATMSSADIRVSAGIFKSWLVEPIVFGLFLADTIITKKHFKNLCWAMILSGVSVALISLGYAVFGYLTFDGRLSAFYLSPNHLAMYLAPALILAIGFWFEGVSTRLKFFLFASCFVLLLSLFFTLSYAAWLSVFAALTFLVVCLRRQRTISFKKFLVFSLSVLVLCSVLFISQRSNQKINDLFNSDRSSWQSRLTIWRAAEKILADRWLVGIGPGLFQKYYLEYQKYFPPYLEWAVPQPQNLFLAFWLQTGLIGLTGFIWLIISFFRWAFAAIKEKKSPLAMVLAAIMIYFLAHGLVDTTYWKNDLALVFWTVIALSYRVGRWNG